jgi:molybdate transport system substrate-binding protein
MSRRKSVALLVAVVAAACSRVSSKTELLVFAAASTADAMSEAAREFEREEGWSVRFSFGATRDLARQIGAGAPADLIVSADAETVEALVAAKLVSAADRRTLMSNRLVIVVPDGAEPTVRAPPDLARVAHLALGDPALVPAGAYARKWLESKHIWPLVERNVVPLPDVRSALSAVEAGHAQAGIVYRTDALRSSKVRIVYEVPPTDAPTIAYVAARLARSEAPAAARLLEFLAGPQARATFARHGFVV